MRSGAALGLLLALLLAACRAPDPKAELEVLDVDAYYAVDPPHDGTEYLAPAIRFQVRNKGAKPARSIDAQVVFRRVGEEGRSWGGDYRQLTSPGRELMPGQSVSVSMKSDLRYTSTGPPQTMFEHKLFRDVKVDVFLRMGSSPWTKMAEARAERRLGTKGLQPGVP